jgi:hypothetical protein
VKAALLEILYSAANSPPGIVVETSDPEALRQKLYALRREYEGDFENLSFVISPMNGSDLWILNKEQADGEV